LTEYACLTEFQWTETRLPASFFVSAGSAFWSAVVHVLVVVLAGVRVVLVVVVPERERIGVVGS
jgi:hypothetical protein